MSGVNLIDFRMPKKEKVKVEKTREWKKWQIPKKDFERLEELTEPPKKEGGKMVLSLGQRVGFIILLIFILIGFFQLVGYYINSKARR
ncbi:hypothetical protein E3E22_10600 [Thermococcus sp. MV5]|uniref:hypothetical protein n=1 Tax=Thermococcus sp. MV5 TaxID=1638272 RepID=UPI00143ABD44|nr:hypothetical protein [Thermococcus sp. MV5]NJE27050.1 hypothetical protein [Thermococcus sp. MV5]